MADIFFNQTENQQNEENSIIKQAQNLTQQTNERAENRMKFGIDAPDEIYEVLNQFAQRTASPEQDQTQNLARVATAYAYSQNMNIPLEEAYANVENYNAAIWGEDIFKNDRRTNAKAVGDQFKLGRNTVKQNKLGVKLMEAERDGDFELAEKINAELKAIDSENMTLQDFNPNNKIIKGLETIVQTVPFTLDVIAAAAIGTVSGTGAIPAFLESSRIQAGDVYRTLREQGNSPEIARKVAVFTGSLQGLAESTIGEASNYFISKGMKGVGNGLSKLGSEKLADYLTKKFALSNGFKKAVQIAGQYAISSVGEGAEELVQEVESILAENIAAKLEDLEIPNADAKEIAKRLTENFEGGIIGGLGLGVLGVFINTGRGIRQVKKIENAAKIIPSEEMYVKEMMKERTDDKGNTYRAADVIVHNSDEDLESKLHDIYKANSAIRNSEENVNAKGRARINPAAEGFETYATDEETGEEIIPEAYRENGKLSYQDDRTTEDDGTVTGEFRVGDRTKADKNLYGSIRYKIDEENKTVTIESFGMSNQREALRQETFEAFADKYTGYDIQWDAKGSAETAVKNAIIEKNPMGKDAGLNYYTLDQRAAKDAETMNKVASQVREAYSNVGINLSDEQIAADVAIMKSLYNRIGREIEGVNSFTDWYDFTFGDRMFAEDPSRAMKNGNEMGASKTRTMQEFRNGMKALIYVTENGDFSTFSHEVAHIFRKQMQGDLLAKTEAAFGVENGQWTKKQEERFAYGFEQFLRTGKAENSAMQELFTKIAQFLKDCFDALTKSGINITPEIEDVYNELLRGDDSTLREAMRAAEQSDKEFAEKQEAAEKEQMQQQKEMETAKEIDKEANATTTFEEEAAPVTEEKTAAEETMEDVLDDELREMADVLPISQEELDALIDTLTDDSETLQAKDDAILDAAGNIFDNDDLFQTKQKEDLEEKAPKVDERRIQQATDYLNSDAFDDAERERIKNNLEKFKGSGWYNLVIQALTVRADMEKMFKHEAIPDNSLFHEMDTYKKICEEGVDSIYDYFTRKSLIGEPEKPEYAVAGSFISCEPSADCVQYCYAVAGRSGMSMIIINRELVNFCVTHDPKRAAQIVTSQWTHMDPYIYGKAPLRLLDTGDMSPQWLDFIKELNSNEGKIPNIRTKDKAPQQNKSIVCSIFSKRGELLSQVDPIANIIQLSVDKTNLEQAEKYPDLPLAIVFDGSDEMVNFIESQKSRFDEHKGVILPVTGKNATPKEDLKKLPRWALHFVCPINAGWQQIGEYYCGNCYLNGQGCSYGRSQKDRYNRYATIGEIPTGVRNDNGQKTRKDLIEEFKKLAEQLGPEGLREAFGQIDNGKSGMSGNLQFMAVQRYADLAQFDNGRETGLMSQSPRTNVADGSMEERIQKENDGDTELLNQIIGELGATNLDRLEEVDTRIRNKNLAKWYAMAGKDPVTIKRATGWEQGADGLWRYEIPDLKIKNHPTWAEMTRDGIRYHFGLLSELIDAPELFAAYPQLKKISVNTSLTSKNTQGVYDDAISEISLNNEFERKPSNKIYNQIVELEKTEEFQQWQKKFEELDEKYVDDPEVWETEYNKLQAQFDATELGKKYNKILNTPRYEEGLDPKIRSTLAHEVQHAIQVIEGFAEGGSPDMFRSFMSDDEIEAYKSMLEGSRIVDNAAAQKIIDKINKNINADEMLSQFMQEIKAGNKTLDDWFTWLQAEQSKQPGYEEYKKLIERSDKAAEELEHIGKYKAPDGKWITPYEAYHRLAGEVESRNVQTRLTLTPEERLEKLLADTADVDPKQQIVMFNALKESMASESEALRGDDDLLFQTNEIRKLYENTDKWMKAPNGKKSNLNEKQWLQVRTESFKKWFGDWENDPEKASKILDENGEPRIVYHDTNRKIFVNKETGEVWDDLDYLEKDKWNERDDWDEYWKEQDFNTFSNKHARTSVEMPAFFFHAEADPYYEYGKRRIAAYLNLRNPAINPKIENAGVTEYAGRDAMDKLISEGYDGFIREEDGVIDEINAFYPNQIKSATDNSGDFNNEDDSFLYQERKEINKKTTKGIYLAANRARHEDYNMDYNDYDDRYGCNIVGDMLEVDLTPYDYIIATPPCNWWSKANPYYKTSEYALKTKHLLPDTIKKLGSQKKPFIIENVKNIKRMTENGIFDLCTKYGLFVQIVGRHTYITNVFCNLETEQIQDFKMHGVRVNNDGYNQGGTNVHRVIEIWLDRVMEQLNSDISSNEEIVAADKDDGLLYQTQEEMINEARQFESWQEWMQFYEVMGKPEVTPIPIDADALWYKKVWEFANGVTNEETGNRIVDDNGPAERALPNDLDQIWIDDILTDNRMFDNFIELAATYDKMNVGEQYQYMESEEDYNDMQRAERLQQAVWNVMSDRNFQYALNAVAAGNPIPDGVKQRILTEMTDSVKARDFRGLYAELMNDDYFRVAPEQDFTTQLKEHYAQNPKRYYDLVKSENEIDKMSPQQRKMLAAEMNNKDLAAKIRSGELEMSDEIHDYIKSLDRQIADLEKQMDKLRSETEDDYRNLNNVEQKQLLNLHEKLLDAQSRHDKTYDYIGKRIKQGLNVTSVYKRQEKTLWVNYEGLYQRFNDLKKTMQITQDVELALKHQEDLQKIKDELAKQQEERKLIGEVKKLRIQLVKRTMRRVPLDTVDYEYAKTIIAIQTMLEPNLIGGVNRFIGTSNALLRNVISGMLTDEDYRKQVIRYIEKTEKGSKASGEMTQRLKNIKDVNEIDSWTEGMKQMAIKRLPKENWIHDLDLVGLGEERRESMDLDINLIPIDNVRINESGEEEHYTTYRLEADDEITARVREAVGNDVFNLLFNVPFVNWKTWQLEELAKIINDLYKEGRDVMNAKRLQKLEAAEKVRRQIEDVVNNTGIAINDDDTPEEKARKQEKINQILGLDDNIKGTNAASDKGFKAKSNRLLHGYNDANVLRFARILDGQKEGINVQQLYRREDECYINKQKSINERVNKINKVLSENKITMEDLARVIEVDGRKFTVDELLFFAAANEDYMDDESLVEKGYTGLMANDNYAATSRNAVMFGSMLSDTESLKYKQMLTEADKEMQRKIQNGQLSVEEQVEYITNTLEKSPGTKAFIAACRERYQKVLDEAAKLDDKYQALRKVIADDYAEQYERMNETSINEFNSPVHRTKCYVPIIRLESNGETNVNQVKEDLLGALGGAAGKQWVNKGMSMRRVSMSPMNQKPVQTGLYKTWTSSVERTEHFISYAPYVTDLNRIYKSRDAQFTRAFIEGRYGKGALRYLDDYINEIANPNANKVREAGAELMHTLRGKTAPAYLSWKLSAIVKQGLTSPFPYMQFVNPVEYLAASAKLITSGGKGYDAIREKSVFMNNRVMDPMNDLIEEMEQQAKTKAGRKLAAFEKKGMAGLEWIDWVCVAPGWLACYEKEYARLNGKNTEVYEAAKQRLQEANLYADYGSSSYMTPEQIEAAAEKEMMDDLEKRAVQYADDCTRQCQPSNRAADIAPLFKNSSEAMKAYLQFQTSLNVIWQNIRYDLPYSFKQRQFWRIAGCVAGYTLAGIFMNAVMEGLPSGDDDDEIDKLKALCYYATTQFTDSVPMIGSELTNTVDKLITGKSSYQSSGTDMTPTATKLMSILTNASKGNWEKAAQMTADGIGLYMGLPVSGLKEIEKLLGVGDGEEGMNVDLGKVYGILDKED